jgi:hypothetical protein
VLRLLSMILTWNLDLRHVFVPSHYVTVLEKCFTLTRPWSLEVLLNYLRNPLLFYLRRLPPRNLRLAVSDPCLCNSTAIVKSSYDSESLMPCSVPCSESTLSVSVFLGEYQLHSQDASRLRSSLDNDLHVLVPHESPPLLSFPTTR